MRTLLLALALALLPLSAVAAEQIPVLLYHHINYEDSTYSVTPERLERDLASLKASGYQTISLASLEKFMAGQGKLPAKPLLITFDDGYADNYRYAYPLLKQYGMTAVFCIVTGHIGAESILTPANIREMAKDKMDFAVHTVSHPLLTDVDDERLKAELAVSRSQLAAILGALPPTLTAMAYPGGSADFRVRRAVVAAGFTLGFSTNLGLVSEDSPEDLLPRIPIFAASRDILREIARAAASPFTY